MLFFKRLYLKESWNMPDTETLYIYKLNRAFGVSQALIRS